MMTAVFSDYVLTHCSFEGKAPKGKGIEECAQEREEGRPLLPEPQLLADLGKYNNECPHAFAVQSFYIHASLGGIGGKIYYPFFFILLLFF